MIDSGSVGTFINRATAEKMKLCIFPKSKTVSLADPNCTVQIIGKVIVDLSLNSHIYTSVVVEVIDSLFFDVIIGKDILQNHGKVTLKFAGPKNELIVGAVNRSGSFPAMLVEPPPLFSNLSGAVKPIAAKSRRYSPADSNFIKSEIEIVERRSHRAFCIPLESTAACRC